MSVTNNPSNLVSQQLELDLWQILAVAQTEPATVGFIELCGHLDGLNLVDGARAVGEIAEIYRVRAETILAEITTTYLPVKEPIVPDELWAHLYRSTFILRDEHLYLGGNAELGEDSTLTIYCVRKDFMTCDQICQ